MEVTMGGVDLDSSMHQQVYIENCNTDSLALL
jgi:hypothetical protein